MYWFLSPHLDDAVLSVGGLIAQLTEAGETVRVITVMAGDPPQELPDTPIVRDLHQRWAAGTHPVVQRRAEDQAAVKLLKAEYMHLNVPDCVYRVSASGESLYPSESSLFGILQRGDPAFSALDSQLGALMPDNVQVYAPLGVGHHVDHQLVRDWAMHYCREAALALTFYEEYPYIKQADAREVARAQMPFDLQEVYHPLEERHIKLKIRAIACYSSQISTFWRDIDVMAVDVKQTFRMPTSGQWGERCWTIT